MSKINQAREAAATEQYTSLADFKEEVLGPVGTPKRDQYEIELKAELLGEAIRKIRKLEGLTQEELGERIGVKKSQISKLEKNGKNVTIDTLLKVFAALNAKVKFRVEIGESELSIA